MCHGSHGAGFYLKSSLWRAGVPWYSNAMFSTFLVSSLRYVCICTICRCNKAEWPRGPFWSVPLISSCPGTCCVCQFTGTCSPFNWPVMPRSLPPIFFFNKAKRSFVPSERTSKWLERAPWVPGTCHCLPAWPTFPFRSNYFQMLTDALKKLGGRGRHERKVEEEEGDSKQKECRML